MDSGLLYVLGPVCLTVGGSVLVAWLRVRRPPKPPAAPRPERDERLETLHRWTSENYRQTGAKLAEIERRLAQLEAEIARDSDAGELAALRAQVERLLHGLGHVEGLLEALVPHHPGPSERFHR